MPGDHPELDTTLAADEIITSIDLPKTGFAGHSAYIKVRDRQSYAFALVSVAVGLEVADGVIARAGVALGGVAHKPWRNPQLEQQLLVGKPANRDTYHEFQRALLAGAQGFGENDFKLKLAPVTVVRALEQAAHEGETGMNTHLIGTDVNRIDGPAKVSGAAKYAAEFFAPDMLYAVVVSGVIAHGEIDSIDTAAAMSVTGAIEVFSHKNRPHMAWFNKSYLDEDAPTDGKPLRPLYDEHIHHSGQPVALCVAETFEAARAMSRLVDVSYKALTHQTDMTVRCAGGEEG